MVTLSTTEALNDAGAIQAHLTSAGITVASVSVNPVSVYIDTEADEATVTAALATLPAPIAELSPDERLALIEATLLDLLGGL